jgi:tetratricopeptide (TPR) repeat protein
VDVTLFGLEPGPHHVVNLALHVVNTCVLFLVFLRLCPGAFWQSATVAALFALHPAHVESVAWISQRKDLLSALLWMLSMWAYARYAEEQGVGRYVIVCALLALGLMAKPMLVTLPVVLLLLDYWPLGRTNRGGPRELRRLTVEKLPLLALVAFSSALTVLVQSSAGALKSLSFVPLDERLVNTILSYVRYLRILVWPDGLAAFYPRLEEPLRGLSWELLAAAAVLAAPSVIAFQLRRSAPALLFGWLWYLGTLVPVIGLVQVGDQSMADRYTYVPYIGLFVAFAFGLPQLLPARSWRAPVMAVAAGGALAGCLVVTSRQVDTWRNSETLWRRVLDVTSTNATAHYHLGTVLLEAEQVDEGIRHLERAAEIRDDVAVFRLNLGTALATAGHTGAAREQYEFAIRLEPDLPEPRLALANVLRREGELTAAIEQFEKALSAKPDLWSIEGVEASYGRALFARNQAPDCSLQETIEHYRYALALKPDWYGVANDFAWILATHPEAFHEHATEAIRLAKAVSASRGDRSPHYLDTLAASYAAAGYYQEAVETAERAASFAADQGKTAAAERIRARIELYRAREAYREKRP